MATNNQLIEGLYVSYFQRPADNPGLEFWGKAMATMSLDAVSAEFAKSTEYQGLVAGKTPEQVVDALYLNVLGRHAEAAALDFYGNALKNGAATVANVVGYITAGAQGSDRVAYADKMVAAELFSAALKVNSAYVLAYSSGGTAHAVGRAYIAGVTDDASLALALHNLESTVSGLGGPIVTMVGQAAPLHDALLA